MRLRAFRFLSERYAQRERPSVVAEFTLFALIVLTASAALLCLLPLLLEYLGSAWSRRSVAAKDLKPSLAS